MEILVAKNDEGGVDVYFDLQIINWNIFPLEGSFPNQKTKQLVESFQCFGVSSYGYPEFTRVCLTNIIENQEEIEKAKKILANLLELISTSNPVHQKTTYELEREEELKKIHLKIKEIREGTHYKNDRKIKFNNIVLESFKILKYHNADPVELSANKFNIMKLKNGFLKPDSQIIDGVINLYEFALSYDIKQSAKKNIKTYSKSNLNIILGVPSIDDFETEVDYFSYRKKLQHLHEKHWYKVRGGLGGKDTNIFFPNNVIKYEFSLVGGYWVQNENRSYFFVFNSDIETIGIDYQSNIFLSICPKCGVKCKGRVFSCVEITCPKCGATWEQYVT